MATVYEWVLELVDASGDIIDHTYRGETLLETLYSLEGTGLDFAALMASETATDRAGMRYSLSLWKSVGTDADGLQHRTEAYFPDLERKRFPNGQAIPERYLAERETVWHRVFYGTDLDRPSRLRLKVGRTVPVESTSVEALKGIAKGLDLTRGLD